MNQNSYIRNCSLAIPRGFWHIDPVNETLASPSASAIRWHERIALPPHPGAAEAFDATIEALIHEFGAEEIWVFGSCARGQPTRHSDVDLMIVRSARPDCLRPSLEALQVIRPFHIFPMDLFVIDPGLWAARRQKPQGVYLDIVRNGRRIYARQDR